MYVVKIENVMLTNSNFGDNETENSIIRTNDYNKATSGYLRVSLNNDGNVHNVTLVDNITDATVFKSEKDCDSTNHVHSTYNELVYKHDPAFRLISLNGNTRKNIRIISTDSNEYLEEKLCEASRRAMGQ